MTTAADKIWAWWSQMTRPISDWLNADPLRYVLLVLGFALVAVTIEGYDKPLVITRRGRIEKQYTLTGVRTIYHGEAGEE